MLPILILFPLAGLLLVSLVVRNIKHLAWGVALALCLGQTALMITGPAWLTAPTDFEKFCGFHLGMTDLSRVILLSVGIVLSCALLVGQAMMDGAGSGRLRNFASLVMVSLIGMNGMALVSDLFSLYVFLEITSVGSFILIAFNRDKAALEGAFKYVILSAVATLLMIGSVALLVMLVGGTSFEGVHQALMTGPENWLVRIAIGGFVCGLLIKGGLVPFHGWVLGAYSAAPAPVSILLGGIATKVSGIYGLIRLTTDVFPHSARLDQAFLAVGAISIVVGAFAAIGQTDLKRLLAYSSISQMGYIVLGLGASSHPAVGISLGTVGAIFHLFNHAIFKSLLFVTSAAVEKQAGTTDMGKLGGLDSKMRLTSATGLLAMLSTAGVPPLSGFWSKLIIVLALWQTGHQVYAVVAVALSVVTLGYMLLMQKRVFFGKISEELQNIREAGPMFTIPAVSLAATTIGVGVMCPFVMNSFLLPVSTFK